MNIDELKTMTNDKVIFEIPRDILIIRSLVFKYEDCMKLGSIESVERQSKSTVRISIPKGSLMGDHDITVNLTTGIVSADGKTFNEPIPADIQPATLGSKRTKAMRFSPTINGFSIKSVQTMPSTDGYAVYCKIFFNDVKVGDFVDKGDGGEYSFFADPPFRTQKIEQAVRSFPPTERDYGLGPMKVKYDMNQIVNDLMEMKDISRELKKLEPIGKDYVVIDDWKAGNHLSATTPSAMTDDELADELKKTLSTRGLTDYEVRRYRSLEDLHVINTSVSTEMLY